MPSTGQIILPQYNPNGDWDEKLITPESGKVLGFDASLNPVMVSQSASTQYAQYLDTQTVQNGYTNSVLTNMSFDMPSASVWLVKCAGIAKRISGYAYYPRVELAGTDVYKYSYKNGTVGFTSPTGIYRETTYSSSSLASTNIVMLDANVATSEWSSTADSSYNGELFIRAVSGGTHTINLIARAGTFLRTFLYAIRIL